MKWKIEDVWNQTIIQQQKPLTAREHIWAGEIGKEFYDRYLKMLAVPPDRPKDDRVLRKFAAGIWFEQQIGHVLKTLGILKSSQERIEIPETAETLKITGKIDYVAGGITDWNQARDNIKLAGFPEFIEQIAYKLVDYFGTKYNDGLDPLIIEVKSVNSAVFWAKKDYLSEAYPHHLMQIYTYLKTKTLPEGRILYISKDDLTVKEIPVYYPDQKLEELWLTDVKQMTYYIRNQVEPPKPESVVFDRRAKLKFQHEKKKYEIKGCYVENWQVAWSDYFTKITGCQTEDEWYGKIAPLIKHKNEQLKNQFKLKLTKNESNHN